jgi:four helix bundle protein
VANERAEHLKERTMAFAVRVITLSRSFVASGETRFVADPLGRAGARTAANDRAACRARSRRDFVNKLGMAVEESDETVFWLEFVERAGLNRSAEQRELLQEGRELLAILMRSARTASNNLKSQRPVDFP